MTCPTAKRIFKQMRREDKTKEQAGCCVYCGRPLVTDPNEQRAPNYSTFEHITAKSLDPRPGWQKAQVMACNACNNLKGSKPLIVFLLQLSQMQQSG